jgi:hypothetical protein
MLSNYQLMMQAHHNHQQVDTCALELAEYLCDHDNWVKPILPGGDGCADMEFLPERFDHLRNMWQCIDQITGW